MGCLRCLATKCYDVIGKIINLGFYITWVRYAAQLSLIKKKEKKEYWVQLSLICNDIFMCGRIYLGSRI